jgi:hypothetical protein
MSQNEPRKTFETSQVGVTPVQFFQPKGIRIVPGMPVEPRLGNPKRDKTTEVPPEAKDEARSEDEPPRSSPA